MTRLVLFELCVTNLLLFEHNNKMLISWQFSGPYGVTKYSSGRRKDVVNQCSESRMNYDGLWCCPCKAWQPLLLCFCVYICYVKPHGSVYCLKEMETCPRSLSVDVTVLLLYSFMCNLFSVDISAQGHYQLIEDQMTSIICWYNQRMF